LALAQKGRGKKKGVTQPVKNRRRGKVGVSKSFTRTEVGGRKRRGEGGGRRVFKGIVSDHVGCK